MYVNASGDFKVKLFLIYHSDNPRVFKQIVCNVEVNCNGLCYSTNSYRVDTLRFCSKCEIISSGERIAIKMPPVA